MNVSCWPSTDHQIRERSDLKPSLADSLKSTHCCRSTTAIFREDTQTASLFQKNGADINAVDKEGRSAAHHAASLYNALPMINWLLDAGANFSLRDHKSLTPACIAEKRRKVKAVSALKAAGKAELNCDK